MSSSHISSRNSPAADTDKPETTDSPIDDELNSIPDLSLPLRIINADEFEHRSAESSVYLSDTSLCTSDAQSYQAVELIHGNGSLPVVASCPHAGRDYPATMLEAAHCKLSALRGLEDFGVDLLLTTFATTGISCVTSKLARAFLDVNRPQDALDGALFDGPVEANSAPSRQVRAGYGLIPTMTADRHPIYKTKLPASVARDRIAALHTPYHELLAAQMNAAQLRHGHALLIDFHSMPHRDRMNNVLPDIILGNCNGTTMDRSIGAAIASFFEDEGLTLRWNHPYAGGFITRNYGRINTARQSIQIEINRGLYMQKAGRTNTNVSPQTSSKMDTLKMDSAQTANIAALLGRFGHFLAQLNADGRLTA